MTTYSVDPAFYDSFIERRLRRSGCENNILLADSSMLTRALSATPAAFRLAGRKYAIVPVSVEGCFHPKIHVRFGRDKARLIVSSANATAAGWCRNLEVLADIDWNPRDEDSSNGPLIRKVYDFLVHWLKDASIDSIQYKCRMIERESPWLRDVSSNEEDIELLDGSSVNVLCDRGGDSPSILRQFADRVSDERPRRFVVISPYWDTQLRGWRELRKTFRDCEADIVLDPERNAFPIDALTSKDDVEFRVLKVGANRKRFPHAKVVLVETRSADHVLFGSANCSDDALGLKSKGSRNAEVCVYRRVAPGTVRDALDLDLKTELSRSKLRPVVPNDEEADAEVGRFDAGYIELSGRTLRWYPIREIDGVGSTIQLGQLSAEVRVLHGRLCAELASQPAGALIAVVTLRSGEISRPVIVHDERALRRAAPGQIDGRLREAFDRIRSGDEDILDLAQYAHIIFAPDAVQEGRSGGGRRSEGSRRGDRKAVIYDTPEQFRQGVALEPATGASGRFSVDDPGLLQVLAIVMRGVGAVGASEDSEIQEREADTDLEAGDSEDDADSAETDESDGDVNTSHWPLQVGKSRIYTSEQITRRRNRLKKTMDAFQELVEGLVNAPSHVSSRVATQTAFMIQLMMFACTRAHTREDGSEIKLMVFYPTHDADREFSFALRVARMLKSIWIGNNCVAQDVVISADHGSLPDDIVSWIVLSRWAIARASLAGRGLAGILPSKIDEVAKGVYAATKRLGPVLHEAEAAMMRELDSQIGLSANDSAELLRHAGEFSAGSPPARGGAVSLDDRARAVRLRH